MDCENLCYLSATEMLCRFRDKSLSPVDVMKAVIERTESVEPRINAFSHTFFESAMERARESESRYGQGRPIGPLDGLPVAIKDETLVEGMPCTNGSLTMKDYVADSTSTNNRRILNAGGILHARTTTPEFSCSGVTWSKLHGITRNPWNPAFTPGGSSGGASASLAAGTTALAMGSDIGGSIRIPASAGGVVGFKPPYGRNPEEIPYNLDFYCHSGPLARCVADIVLLQNVISGPDPGDIATLKPKLELPEKYPGIQGWKIAWSMNLGYYEVEKEVEKNTLAALDIFRDLGAVVEEVDIDWTTAMLDAGKAYLDHLFGYTMYRSYREHGDLLTPYAKAFALAGSNSTQADFWSSYEVAGEMYRTMGPLLDTYRLFICPTNNLAAVAADHDQSRDTVTVNGREVDPLLGWVMTLPFNMMSRCPVISIQSGWRRDAVPTGIQLVGPSYEDARVIQAAMAYESAVGQWYRDPAHRPTFEGRAVT
ncbi:MAG: amidase [Gammaproteobacteria bacterium]|nr:amidase [Gammaproteobacteria bacterium]MYD76005.1 amidase [Gammaproteobacteria bacterium]MYJ51673.1 amidase [Gammaproteobacteria bacterium]